MKISMLEHGYQLTELEHLLSSYNTSLNSLRADGTQGPEINTFKCSQLVLK